MTRPHRRAPALAAAALCLLLLFAGLPPPAAALEMIPSEVEARDAAALKAAIDAPRKTSSCGTAPLIIVYGSQPPTSLGALVEDQPPLPRLPHLGSARDLELHAASDASGCLSSVKRVRGTLLILDDGTLGSSLPPLLSSLQRVDEGLIVYGASQSAALTSLSGLGALEAVGHLAVARLPRLASLGGLDNLRTINGDLTLWRLPELQTLDNLGPIREVQGRLWIENTPKLLSLGRLPPLPPVAPVVVPPAAPTEADPTTSEKITKQDDNNNSMSGLSALRSVASDLHIERTDLPSLELPFLTTVGGEVALLGNRRLASTQGLRSLSQAFGVALINNELLADVDGFARLRQLQGDLSLVRNRAIQSVNGFKNLAAVGLTVDVSSNDALRSLDGFSGLQQVGQLLNVAFNPSLEALRGFGGLQTVGADLIVRNNTKLRELTDLGASLRAVGAGPSGGSLIVEGNPELASLAPLASPPLQTVRGPVRVRAGNGLAADNAKVAAGLEAVAQPGFEMAVPGLTPAAPAAAPAPAVVPVAGAPAAAVVPPQQQQPPAGAAIVPPAAATVPAGAAAPRAGGAPVVAPSTTPMAAPGAAAAATPATPVAPTGGGGAFVNSLTSG